MLRINRTELLGGLVVLFFGLYFFIGAHDYRMGTAARMGPGYVPYVLGMIQCGLGLVITLGAFGSSEPLRRLEWREMLAVTGALLAFALLLPRMGLIAAISATTAVSMLGNRDWKVLTILLCAAVMSLLCWLVFIVLLGLPMQAFRSPF